MFNEAIDLGKSIETKIDGEVIDSIQWEFRLANQLNDNRSEFYQGAAAGLKPELTFEINGFEYGGEEYVRFPAGTGVIYSVIRASKRGEMRELICTTHTGVDVDG